MTSQSERMKALWRTPEFRAKRRATYQRTPWQERFWAKVDRRGPDDCWLWMAAKTPTGYGHYVPRPLPAPPKGMAHRIAYELLVGAIPEGLTIDHLCGVPSCCNPAHMEPVTIRENILRGSGPPAQNARKTHCPKGHAYDYVKPGDPNHRRCRTCERKWAREAARRRAALQPRKPRVLKTHCPAGHPYDEANTIHVSGGRRMCRECNRVRSRDFKRRKYGYKPRTKGSS